MDINEFRELEIAVEGLVNKAFDSIKKYNEEQYRKEEERKARIDAMHKEKFPKYWAKIHANDPKPKPKPRTIKDDMNDAYADLPKEITVTLGNVKKTLKVKYYLGYDDNNDPYFVDPKRVKAQVNNFIRLHAKEFKADEKEICEGIIRSWLQYYDDDCKKKTRGRKTDTYADLIEIFGVSPDGICVHPDYDDNKRVMFLIELNFEGFPTQDDGYYLKFQNNKWDINVVSGEGGYE